MSKIEQYNELKRNLSYKQKELSEIKSKIDQLKRDIALDVHGVKEGSIVVDDKGKEYRVQFVRVRLFDPTKYYKPWVIGNPRRKDSTFGTSQRNMFRNWTLVSTN